MNQHEAIIFDIQKFSVHDGPGIRTLVFLKGCPLKCLWCSNPESQSGLLELVFQGEKCVRAKRCLNACPTEAIFLNENKLGLDRRRCNLCGKCADACYAEAWKMFGRAIDADSLMKEIQKDAVFYRASGGGVTFGGGEPLLWPEFVAAIGKRCKSEHISVAVETCGCVTWNNFEKVLDSLDLVLFDLKHMDPEMHKRLCGQSNELILENLKTLSRKNGVKVVIRMPIIPGLNDGEKNISETARFIISLGAIKDVEILPYHKLGERKYERLGREYELHDLKAPSEEHMHDIKSMIENHGLTVRIGG